MKFAYTVKIGSLKKFLEKIPLVGIPSKVTQKFLYALDFKSTNDRKMIPILKFIKFLDDSGVPTDYYRKYRDKARSSKVLGRALKESYSELFKVYPNAEKQDNNAIRNFFSTHTGLGEKAVKSMVDTFKTLCSMADFGVISSLEEDFVDGEEKESSYSQNSIHGINLALSKGRKARILVPEDINEEEINKLKKLLDALK